MAEQYNPGILARAYQLQAEEQARREAENNQRMLEAQQAAEAARDRTAGELAGDFGTAALQTAVGLGGAVYGAANMLTLGTLDRVTGGFSENFDRTQQILQGFKSSPLQRRQQELKRRFDEEGALSGAGYLATTPSLLLDYGLQSAGYLLPGAAAARVAGRVAQAGTAARGGSKLAQVANAEKAATRAALTAQGVQTAGYLNVDAINAAREAGRSETEQQLYGLGAGAAGAVLGPAISRLTGAAGMEARAAQMFGGAGVAPAAGSLAARTAAGAGVQATEEGLQESYEQVVRNIAGDRELTEGVAQSATIGAVLGGILGAGIGAAGGSPAAQQAQKMRADLEGQLGTQLRPSPLSDWTAPGGGENAATRELQAAQLRQQVPDVAEASLADYIAASNPEQIDMAAASEQGVADAELEAYARQVAAEDAMAAAPVEEITLTEAQAPLREQVPQVEELTGIRAILAEREARRIPQPQVTEIMPEQVDMQPDAPSSVADVYRSNAPLAGVAARFGVDAAQAEAVRRGPAALNLEEVEQYFGVEEAYRQSALRQMAEQQVPTQAEPVAPQPIDLTQPKVKRDYLREMRTAVSQATGEDGKRFTGKAWNELIAGAAAEGITPASPDFGMYMGHQALVGLANADTAGKNESPVLARIANAYPLNEDQQIEASLRWGGADANEEAMFGQSAVESLAEVAPEVANNWLNEEHRAYVEGFVAELVEGGDVSYVRGENDRIVGRTPSINPDWWKDLDPAVKPNSVRDAKAIVAKAQAGERLGKKQTAFLAHLLDMADAQVSENRAYREQQAADTQRERSQAGASAPAAAQARGSAVVEDPASTAEDLAEYIEEPVGIPLTPAQLAAEHAMLDPVVDGLSDSAAERVAFSLGINTKRVKDIRAAIKSQHPDDQRAAIAGVAEGNRVAADRAAQALAGLDAAVRSNLDAELSGRTAIYGPDYLRNWARSAHKQIVAVEGVRELSDATGVGVETAFRRLYENDLNMTLAMDRLLSDATRVEQAKKTQLREAQAILDDPDAAPSDLIEALDAIAQPNLIRNAADIELPRAAANETKLKGVSAPAAAQARTGKVDAAFADFMAGMELAQDADSLDVAVVAFRTSPNYDTLSYDQKLLLENRVAERMSELGGYDFHLADNSPALTRKPLTDSPAFKKWFGDSKVVDADGKPRVVYHGTTKDVAVFDAAMARSEGGEGTFFFASERRTAGTYATPALSGGNVMPVYLSIKNPLVTGFTSAEPGPNATMDEWRAFVRDVEAFNRGLDDNKTEYFEREIAKARAAGHDGVVFKYVEDDSSAMASTEPTDVIVAFRPEQIKSAIGNNGNFDPTNPDIRLRTDDQKAAPVLAKRRFDTLVNAMPARLGVRIEGVDTVADASALLGRQLPATMKGVYTPDGRILVVRENHTDIKDLAFTIAHEQGHLGLDKLLGPHLRSAANRMWANGAMRKRIKAKMAAMKITGETDNATRARAAEEVLADMLASGERLNKDVWAKLKAGVKEFFAKLFGVRDYIVTNDEVDGLLRSVAQVIKGDATPTASAREPEMRQWFTDTDAAANADDKFSTINAEFEEVLAAAQREEGSQKVPPVSDFLKSAGEATAQNAQKLVSQVKNGSLKDVLVKNFLHLNQLASFYDKLFGGRIAKLADLKSEMEATFNKMNARAEKLEYRGENLGTQSVNDLAKEWAGFSRRQPNKHRALNTMMQNATFFKVFPDLSWDEQSAIDYNAAGYTEEERQQAHTKVAALYRAVGTEGQSIYKRAQAVYENRWNTRFAVLAKELDRIGKVSKDDGADPALVDRRIKKFKDDIRLALGKISEGPYSPLQRNGEHTVVVTNADDGSVIHFSAHDTKEAAQATSASLRQQYDQENSGGNFNVIVSTRADFDSRLGGTSVGDVEAQRRNILSQVESLLPDSMDAQARVQVSNTVSSALTEAYLTALPDRSFMKHARTRKNIDGYDLDAFRAFADYSLRSARDIAGIQFDGRIASALNDIEKFTKDITLGKMRPDGTEGVYTGDTALIRTVADAVKRQHASSLDVVENKVVNGLTQAGFMWFMTSPSQLFLNATQTHLVALPRLAARYGGGRAAKEIHKAMAQFAKSKGSMLSEGSVLRTSGDARDTLVLDVLQQLHDEGPLDLTQAHQVSEYSGGRNAALTPYMSKAMEVASMFMHRSEVFNREVTSAAAVKLELTKRGQSVPAKGTPAYDALVADMTKVGTRAIDATHYNYAQSNKPAVMQGSLGKLVFQFQQYRFHTLAMMAKDIRDARLGKAVLDPIKKVLGKEVTQLSPMDKEEAREARAALSWLLGMQLAFTGAAGTVLAPFAFAIADAFKDDDDLTDSRTDFINYAGKYLSHGVLAGLVDTQRISAATLIPYYGEKGYEPVGGKASEVFEYHLMRNLGPWVGLLGDTVDGGAALMNGDVYKASQELLPKPFRDAIKATTEATSGIRDQREVLYADPSALSTITGFLGLRSAERRDVEQARSAVYRANKIASTSRDRYLTRLAIAQASGDTAELNEARAEITDWNQKYPDLAITGQEMRRAIVSRMRSQSIATATGVPMYRMPGQTISEIIGQ